MHACVGASLRVFERMCVNGTGSFWRVCLTLCANRSHPYPNTHLLFTIGAVSIDQMVAGLKRLGFDAVFDTNFGADLTVCVRAPSFSPPIHVSMFVWAFFFF